MRYWLIAEPARGTSVRVDVPAGTDPEDALLKHVTETDPDLAAEFNAAVVGYATLELADFLRDETGDSVQLVEE
jgi:hypothetical protein